MSKFICTRCKTEIEVDTHRAGRKYCRPCANKIISEKHALYQKKYYSTPINKEKHRIYCTNYTNMNRERINAYARNYQHTPKAKERRLRLKWEKEVANVPHFSPEVRNALVEDGLTLSTLMAKRGIFDERKDTQCVGEGNGTDDGIPSKRGKHSGGNEFDSSELVGEDGKSKTNNKRIDGDDNSKETNREGNQS